jgi:hypothetical protein
MHALPLFDRGSAEYLRLKIRDSMRQVFGNQGHVLDAIGRPRYRRLTESCRQLATRRLASRSRSDIFRVELRGSHCNPPPPHNSRTTTARSYLIITEKVVLDSDVGLDATTNCDDAEWSEG